MTFGTVTVPESTEQRNRYFDSMSHVLTVAALYTPAGEPITDPQRVHDDHCNMCRHSLRADADEDRRNYAGLR